MVKVDRFLIGIAFTFHGLVEYARILEDQVKRISHAEALRIKRTGYVESWESSDAWHEHRWLFEETLPRSLRYSCLVLLFTALEQILKEICEKLRQRSGSKLSFTNLKGNTLQQTLDYFEKVLDVKIPDDTFRSHLYKLYELRNCIVHAGGKVEPSKEAPKLKGIINQLEGFELSRDGYLEIKNGACGRELKDTRRWVENLWQTASALVPIRSAPTG
jgi:hypothetical protein